MGVCGVAVLLIFLRGVAVNKIPACVACEQAPGLEERSKFIGRREAPATRADKFAALLVSREPVRRLHLAVLR